MNAEHESPARTRAVPWEKRERGLKEARLEMRCARARLRKRWWLVLLLTTLLTGLVAAMVWLKQPKYPSRVVMRVEEMNLDQRTAPPTNHQLKSYLSDVALSRGALVRVMKKHGIESDTLRLNLGLAIERMRDAIELEIAENHFAAAWHRRDLSRSAKIVIRFRHQDPDIALAVARELGELVVAHQRSERQELSAETARWSQTAVDDLRDRLAQARRQVAEIEHRLQAGSTEDEARDAVKLGSLRRSIAQLEDQVDQLSVNRDELQLRSAFEGEALGMRFEIIDHGERFEPKLPHSQVVALVGMASFLLLFPTVALGVGTFDATLRDRDSVRRLGLNALGHVPPFRGDNFGRLSARSRVG